MAPGQVVQRSTESIRPQRRIAIFLLYQPRTTPSRTGIAAVAECHQFSPRCFGSRCAAGQKVGLSAEASSLLSSAPTSKPSGCRCSSFVSGTSSATLHLLMQFSVCCIDQLNPPLNSDVRGRGIELSRRCLPVIAASSARTAAGPSRPVVPPGSVDCDVRASLATMDRRGARPT